MTEADDGRRRSAPDAPRCSRARRGAPCSAGSASSRCCPAIAVLFVVGIARARRSSRPRTSATPRRARPRSGMVVVAETLILLTGSFDLSLQSIYGLAPMVGAWLIVPKDGQGLGTDWNPRVRDPRLLGDRRRGRALQRLHDREAALQRVHLHARDADPARRASSRASSAGSTIYDMPASFTTSAPPTGSGSRSRRGSTIAVFLVAGLFLRYHRTGRAVYAIGGNLEAARAAGIKVDRIRIGVFTRRRRCSRRSRADDRRRRCSP